MRVHGIVRRPAIWYVPRSKMSFGLLTGGLVLAGIAAAGPSAAAAGPSTGSTVTAAATAAATARTVAPTHRFAAPDGGQRDEFGRSVALSGPTAVVGAPNHAGFAGGVYVYARSGGTWALNTELANPAGSAQDAFGSSVAVSGNTVVVGAPQNAGLTGVAYVFVRSVAHWVLQATLTAPGAAPYAEFGYTVAVSGDTAFVSMKNINSAVPAGVYVFHRSQGSWALETTLESPSGAGMFGQSLAASGSTLVVGAPFADPQQTGSAYVYTDGVSGWTPAATLSGADTSIGDEFGWSVSVSGDVVVVGSLYHATTGQAYVFTRSGAVWTQTAELIGSDSVLGDEFGTSVGASAGMIVVGAPRAPRTWNKNRGVAYVFTLSGGVWVQTARLVPKVRPVAGYFAMSMSTSGARVILGELGANQDTGLAYLFRPLG